ncbi:hypothetical protein [Actinoplanes sp. HUAS TT8]|uniref:hypothetical protein n=1 Tax=Actinoplanes sp. HUAS TT8 TaxID=3447453 RepID=UPI003F523E2C
MIGSVVPVMGAVTRTARSVRAVGSLCAGGGKPGYDARRLVALLISGLLMTKALTR